jgi:DNA (cytosine-5)-methyltransferase 1
MLPGHRIRTGKDAAMSDPWMLDAFCGDGGATKGYQLAGFRVLGVDIEPHPNYCGEDFVQGDAVQFIRDNGHKFAARHASPPCPHYSSITPAANREDHPDLIAPTRAALLELDGPYVIENVPGSPLLNPFVLCGAAFGLGTICRDGRWRHLRRHRLFESNVWMLTPGCACRGEAVGVYGDGGGGPSTRPSGGGGYKAYPEEARRAMGIDWANRHGLTNAIPPAYTEFIGEQLLEHLASVAA